MDSAKGDRVRLIDPHRSICDLLGHAFRIEWWCSTQDYRFHCVWCGERHGADAKMQLIIILIRLTIVRQ